MKDGDSKGVKEEKIGKYDITTCVEECKVSLTKRFKNYLISGENLLQPWCQINGADGPNKSGEVALGEIWSNAAWISQPKVIFVMKVDIVIIITFVFISTEKVSVEHSIIVVSIHRAGGEEEGLP